MKIYIIGHKSPDLDAIASAVQYSEYLQKTNRYPGHELIPARAGEANAETRTIFGKFDVTLPVLLDECDIVSDDAFILVDHNEEAQRHEKVNGDSVIEIVDHHKININFTSPVRIDVKPMGSTSSIIFELFKLANIEPSKKTASLILAGILSDTVGLKSSTTTGYDSEYAHELSKRLDLDIEKLTFDIFKAKSDITGLTPLEIAKKDFKVFKFGDVPVFINQVETVEPQKILDQKEELITALNEAKSSEGAAQGYLIVTDILNSNSQAIYTNEVEKQVIEQAFTTQGTDNVADIGPKMSRKKDIAPAIEAVAIRQ